MPSLTDLSAQWEELDSLLSVSGGEVTPEVQATLDELLGLEAEKLERYGWYIKHLRGAAVDAKTWASEFSAKAKTAQSRADWLMERLADYMVARGLEKVRGGPWDFAFQRNSVASVELTILPEELPPRFQRVTIEANKDALRQAIESGASIPGVTLGERGRSLRIR